MNIRRRCALAALLFPLSAMLGAHAKADGVSNYLPLNLEPEIERQIERVLILADEPILKRPFAVGLVEAALPQACMVDEPLCERVRRYLERYSRDYAVTHASATLAKTHGADTIVPNANGLSTKSDWELSGVGFAQPNDYLLASVGVTGYSGRTVATGSMLSFGSNWAQVDVGYRDHWFSPLTDSSQLISTEAPTTPSVTLSNYEPIGSLGFQYELFLTRLSQAANNIVYNGIGGSGNPRLFGAQFSIEPFSGWSIGVNRLLEYGGGDKLPGSASFLVKDFFRPSGLVQNESNQQASYVSRFLFPGKPPFAVYVQYAGENTEDGGSYLLGNAALSAGIDLPRLARYFDATYEISEWQNTWYTHFIYQDGMSNDGLVLGNWGADQRLFDNGIGARSQMLRIGWTPSFGGYLEERVRTVVNQNYYSPGDSRQYSAAGAPYPYRHYSDFTLRYSRPWDGATVGGEIFAGRDVFGKSFSRISAFVRYGGDERTRDEGTVDETSNDALANVAGAEWFVDAGINANKVRANIGPEYPSAVTPTGIGPHVGIGARRAVSDTNDLGMRLEVDEVQKHSLLGLRVVDYRHRFGDDYAVGLFAGATRYDLATPAYSMYAGAGVQWRNVQPKWDLGLDFRYAQNVARDKLLASDPKSVRPDSFYKIESGLLYVSRRF